MFNYNLYLISYIFISLNLQTKKIQYMVFNEEPHANYYFIYFLIKTKLSFKSTQFNMISMIVIQQ